MLRTIDLGRLFGVPIRLHWTVWLLLIWLAVEFLIAPVRGVLLATVIGMLFASVLAHELGHALASRRFGLKVAEILITPLAGMTRFESTPKSPLQDAAVSAAGPAVNILLGAACLPVLLHNLNTTGSPVGFTGGDVPLGVPTYLALLGLFGVVNISLAALNLLPAFPLDGGRIARSLLTPRLGDLRATSLIANVGRVAAVGFAVLAIASNLWFLLLALFVWLASAGEERQARHRQWVEQVKTGQAPPVPPDLMRLLRLMGVAGRAVANPPPGSAAPPPVPRGWSATPPPPPGDSEERPHAPPSGDRIVYKGQEIYRPED